MFERSAQQAAAIISEVGVVGLNLGLSISCLYLMQIWDGGVDTSDQVVRVTVMVKLAIDSVEEAEQVMLSRVFEYKQFTSFQS